MMNASNDFWVIALLMAILSSAVLAVHVAS
jgi:hypothetical protein